MDSDMEEEKHSDGRGSTRRKPTSSPRTAIFLPNAALGDGKVRGLGDSMAWNHAAWGGHEAQGQPGGHVPRVPGAGAGGAGGWFAQKAGHPWPPQNTRREHLTLWGP